MPTIKTVTEKRRGCGYRKPGGKYLVNFSGAGRSCGRLPIPLVKCPCCGGGIGRSSWPTMIQGSLLLSYPCKAESNFCHGSSPFVKGDSRPFSLPCPFWNEIKNDDPVLLLWIGERYYTTPQDFNREAERQGISRRITQIPKGFVIGKTWVALGHANAITEVDPETGEVTATPGVFKLFKPEAMQYVVKGDETEEELERLEKQGFELVHVVRAEETAEAELPFDDQEFCEPN